MPAVELAVDVLRPLMGAMASLPNGAKLRKINMDPRALSVTIEFAADDESSSSTAPPPSSSAPRPLRLKTSSPPPRQSADTDVSMDDEEPSATADDKDDGEPGTEEESKSPPPAKKSSTRRRPAPKKAPSKKTAAEKAAAAASGDESDDDEEENDDAPPPAKKSARSGGGNRQQRAAATKTSTKPATNDDDEKKGEKPATAASTEVIDLDKLPDKEANAPEIVSRLADGTVLLRTDYNTLATPRKWLNGNVVNYALRRILERSISSERTPNFAVVDSGAVALFAAVYHRLKTSKKQGLADEATKHARDLQLYSATLSGRVHLIAVSLAEFDQLVDSTTKSTGTHWVLFVYLEYPAVLKAKSPSAAAAADQTPSSSPRTVFILDSLPKNYPGLVVKYCNLLKEALARSDPSGGKVDDVKFTKLTGVPEQNNIFDCGVHLLSNARLVTRSLATLIDKNNGHLPDLDTVQEALVGADFAGKDAYDRAKWAEDLLQQ